jgi:hypothetical protein
MAIKSEGVKAENISPSQHEKIEWKEKNTSF